MCTFPNHTKIVTHVFNSSMSKQSGLERVNILAVNSLIIFVQKESDGQTCFFELLVKMVSIRTFRHHFTKKIDAENAFSSNAGFIMVIKKFILCTRVVFPEHETFLLDNWRDVKVLTFPFSQDKMLKLLRITN